MSFLGFSTTGQNFFIDRRNQAPKPAPDSKHCSCGKGVLVKTVTANGKYTDIKCTRCKQGYHFSNFVDNNFPFLHPQYKPVIVTPNPDFAHYRNVKPDKDLEFEDDEQEEVD